MRIRKLAAAALLGVAALGVSACATGLPANVTRYSAMPIPQGQSFYVVPATGGQPSLEFQRYAAIVSQQLAARGYRPAASPSAADMLVRLSYQVDEGTTERTIDPMARSRYNDPFYRGYRDPFYRGYDPRFGGYDPRFGGYDPRYGGYDPRFGGYYGRPYYSRYGYYGRYRDPFYYGWDDPYWYSSGYGAGYRDPIREYTVYESALDLDIVRRVDNAPLFDGKAVARSQTDELGVLVPNLIEAMFTNFPGRNGETVKITVPARKRG